MKIKKISLFFAAVMAVLCVMPATLGLAFAATDTADRAIIEKVADARFASGYEYKADYVAEKVIAANGLVLDEKDADGNSISYYFDYAKSGAEEEDYSDEMSTSSSTAFTFKQVPADKYDAIEMTMRVFTKNDSEREYKSKALVFYVIDSSNNENSVRYTDDIEVIKAYQKAVTEKADAKGHGENFYYPDLTVEVTDGDATAEKNLIVSDIYDASDLKKTVYYAKPDSTSFTSTASAYFKLSEVGTYKFYITFEDHAKNAAFVDLTETDEEDNVLYEQKIVDGIEGFYDKENNLIVPVFTLSVSKGKSPEITIGTSPKGYFGLEYEVESFDVNQYGNNFSKKYTLYFSKINLSEGITNWRNVGVEIIENAVKGGTAFDITEEEAYEFDSSELTFTPNGTAGYYFVICRAADDNGTNAKVCDAIAVSEGFSEVKRAFDVGAFFKNNYLSIIFLSIAVLSAIGIVLLIFIKPKEKTADEEVTPVAKK